MTFWHEFIYKKLIANNYNFKYWHGYKLFLSFEMLATGLEVVAIDLNGLQRKL